MAASQQSNKGPNIQINTQQTGKMPQNPHTYSNSQPHYKLQRYQSSPIAHWGNQYNNNSNMNLFYQNNMRHAVNGIPNKNQNQNQNQSPSNPNLSNEPEIMQSQRSQPSPHTSNPSNANANANASNHHKRNSSLSMSYIQQRQQAFFSDAPEPQSDSNSDDEIYDSMYKDGLGANNPNIKIPPPKDAKKHKKMHKKQANKSRQETEDVWCCSVCTYQNNMLLGYCELCGCKKSNKPSIIKRAVYGKPEAMASPDSSEVSPSPKPDDIGLFDIGTEQQKVKDSIAVSAANNDIHQQIPALLSIPPPKEQHKHAKHKKQALHMHKSKSKSESNILNISKHWRCSVCTYAENSIERPVCKMCGALPPERPPSPNPPFIAKPKGNNSEEFDLMSQASNTNANNIKSDSNEETDPLGHQKSASITELPIVDESVLKQQIDFGYKNTQLSVNNSNNSSELLSVSNGGVSYHNASQSGQNIIRGLQPYDIPDLPAEKLDSPKQNTNSIANMGVDVNSASNNEKPSGIGGWFGKVYNVARRRGQSTENNHELSPPNPNQKRNRSKSPRNNLSQIKETSKRNISVATMPQKQQEKIAKRLNGLHSKKDLLRELDSSQTKLQKKLKQHAHKVMQLKAEINVLERDFGAELQQWNAWYVLELVDIAKDYYSHKLSSINHQIELEKLHIECFTEKLQRLENASANIKKHKKWTIDDVRNNIEVAFHTAWRIRLSQDVPDKQDYVKQLRQLTANLHGQYQSKRASHGKHEIAMQVRKERVFLFLESVLAKYESTQQSENKAFKLQRNLGNDDDFYVPYDETDQNVFDSFILDQRTKEGRIVSRWVVFIKKKHRDITFEDLSDFMQKLAHTFLHSYSLQSKQYFECVRILCFRCIFRRRIIKKIIYELLNGLNTATETNAEVTNMAQITAADTVYQKKVMWMRALNAEKLGIVSRYWLKTEIKLPKNNNLSVSSQNGRRSSQIALLAGKDIPFAESINLMGQLEIDYHIIVKYKESLLQSQAKPSKSKSETKVVKRSVFGRAKHNSNSNSESEAKEKERYTSSRHNNIIPFLLPQHGLQTLLLATKSIYNNAMRYYYTHYPEKKGDVNDDGAFISQDDLFPIILYCVIQSKLETPHKMIHFIEHILPKEKSTMGQSAFALSALKAAVEYISQAKPTTFGMDAEIELD